MHVRINELTMEKTLRDGRDPKTNIITQREIEDVTGIPQGTISRWAGDKVDRLDKYIIKRLCDYFECEVGDLIQLTERDTLEPMR